MDPTPYAYSLVKNSIQYYTLENIEDILLSPSYTENNMYNNSYFRA